MSELKPCPFCGGEAEVVHTRSGDDFVRCVSKSCHARTRNYHEAENLAVDAWNARADKTCENVAPEYLDFLCSRCGFVHYHSDENDTGDGNEWNFCPNCGGVVKR